MRWANLSSLLRFEEKCGDSTHAEAHRGIVPLPKPSVNALLLEARLKRKDFPEIARLPYEQGVSESQIGWRAIVERNLWSIMSAYS